MKKLINLKEREVQLILSTNGLLLLLSLIFNFYLYDILQFYVIETFCIVLFSVMRYWNVLTKNKSKNDFGKTMWGVILIITAYFYCFFFNYMLFPQDLIYYGEHRTLLERLGDFNRQMMTFGTWIVFTSYFVRFGLESSGISKGLNLKADILRNVAIIRVVGNIIFLVVTPFLSYVLPFYVAGILLFKIAIELVVNHFVKGQVKKNTLDSVS